MRFRVLGVELDRFAVERIGVFQSIAPRAQDSQVVVRLCIRWIELERGLVTGCRFIVTSVALENLSEIVPADGRVGPQRDGALDERERRCEIAGLQRDDTEQVQRVGMPRLALQYRAIAPLRVGQAAGPMVL